MNYNHNHNNYRKGNYSNNYYNQRFSVKYNKNRLNNYNHNNDNDYNNYDELKTVLSDNDQNKSIDCQTIPLDGSTSQNRTKDYQSLGSELQYYYKVELLDYLYQNIDLYQLRYCIMKTHDHAQQLKQQQYHITSHFHGYNYFLIFKKLSDNITSAYLVCRMDLKFIRQEVNVNLTKIYKLDINKNIDYLNNSIIDGKLIFKKDQKLFLINDILYFKGIKYFTMKIVDKIERFDSEITNINKILNHNFESKFIRIYKYSDMADLVYNKIKNSDFKINGLVFIPHRSGKIYIYINDQEFDSIKNSPNLEINLNITNVKLPSNSKIDNRELLIQKTQIVDVYEVFTLKKEYRFGICCVPNIELSKKLREYFKYNDQLITLCEYDNNFSKWKPLL